MRQSALLAHEHCRHFAIPAPAASRFPVQEGNLVHVPKRAHTSSSYAWAVHAGGGDEGGGGAAAWGALPAAAA
eukprot:1161923-Pelagomonas_calceolata.AAC.20